MKKNTTLKTTRANAKELTNVLWDTLQKVKNKKIKPVEANSIARVSREMLAISKLQLEYAKFTGAKTINENLLT